MDRKSIIILVVCLILFLVWAELVPRFYPPPTPARRTNQLATTAASNLPPASLSPTTNLPPARAAEQAEPSAPEELLAATNNYARYTFTSRGGGLKVVELKAYPEAVSCRGKKPPGADRLASLNSLAPDPVLTALNGDGLDAGSFKMTTTSDGVRAEKTLANGLTVVKEFRPGSNYLLHATLRLENHSAQDVHLPPIEWVLGTATPMNPKDNGQLVGVTWYNGSSSQDVEQRWFANPTLGCFPGTPRPEYRVPATNLVWAALRNQFFALAIMTPTNAPPSELMVREITLPPIHNETNALPQGGAAATKLWLFDEGDFKDPSAFLSRLRGGQDSLSAYFFSHLSDEGKRLVNSYSGGPVPTVVLGDLNKILSTPALFQENRDYFARLTLKPATRRLLDQTRAGGDATRLNRVLIEEAFPRELLQSPLGFEAALGYPAALLPPGQTVERTFNIYAGPKEYRTVNEVGLQYNNNLEAVMGYSGFFGFFAKALLLSMNGLHALGLGYAAAIIAITVIIKLLFWPLTQASTRSMKRMQALQPQIKAIQEKYKDDPMKAQRKVMEVWKENKISPLGGCLPMFLQLPVFLGFYRMIQSAIELRGAKFLWVCDLSRPDTLFILPGLNFPFNPLPLLMGVTMLWQARLTPPSPGMDPSQQKIMKYMPLMFLFILYNFSAGLTLYWTVQNLLTIAQTKLTRAKDEQAGAGPRPLPGPVPKKKK
jgi:YidC/Oxa1 family membrane protein insertase